jgi:hypothetical protein
MYRPSENMSAGQPVQNSASQTFNLVTPWRDLEIGVRRQLQTLNQQAIPAQKQAAIRELSNLMTQAYSRGLFDSESKDAKLLSDYRTRDNSLAVGFLASKMPAFIFQSGWPTSFFVGIVLGALHREGLLKEAQIDKDYLNAVEKEWRERLELLVANIKAEREDSASRLATLESETNAVLGNAKDDLEQHKKAQSESQTQFSAFLANCNSEWEELRQGYDAKLAFQAPITYWRKKEKQHKD